VDTYKYCNITRFDMSADICPISPLEDKFLSNLSLTIT
jgi:hypothetical protein